VKWETPKVAFPLEYIAGFYDAEGGCRNPKKFRQGLTKTIHYWASIRCKHNALNEPLMYIQKTLKEFGVKSQIYDNDELVLTGKENLRNFYNLIPLKHPRKRGELKDLITFKRTGSAEA